MVIAQSFWRKAVVTVVAATAFVAFYETRMFDSTFAVLDTLGNGTDHLRPAIASPSERPPTARASPRRPGSRCRTGIAAADPTVLPVGSVVEVDVGSPKYDGIYTILDTGPSVQGRVLDVYMWSCYEALAFGRKDVRAHRASSRLESAIDHPELHRPVLQAAGQRAASRCHPGRCHRRR